MYSIDLIGYGYSDKPNPREFGGEPFYTFETWGEQLNDFCLDVVKDEAFFICNSIGGRALKLQLFSGFMGFFGSVMTEKLVFIRACGSSGSSK